MNKLHTFAAALILVSPFARAQGFQVNVQGQIQQGMGGAGTGLVQDGAVLFYNPGGASFLKGNTVNAGVSPTIPKGMFLDKNTNQKFETTSPVSYPFAAYALFGIKDSSKLKFGIAAYTPFGSTVDWEEGWAGRFVLTHLQLQAIYIQPSVSYKITDKIGIGAGFVYANGKVNLQRDLPVIDASGNYGHAELNGKANGYGFNAGIYFKPIDKLSLGLTYRSQVNMTVNSGDATFTVPSALQSSFPNGKFKATLPLPQVVTLGIGFTANEKLSFALDINYVGWKAYDTLAFDYETNTTTLKDTRSPRMYENSMAFRLGGQYKITSQFSARLGIAYGMTPVQDGYQTPETPDANRINYTAGIGYNLGKGFGADASFLFTTLKREGTNIETKLNGTYKTNVCIPGLSLHYNF